LHALKAQIAQLDEKIEKGNERLLLLPADLLAGASAKVRMWQQERGQLLQQIRQVEKMQVGGEGDIQEDVEKALACLQNLQSRLAEGEPPPVLREVIRQMVARIECWFDQVPYGQKGRTCSRISRGLIHLRPDLIVSRDVPHGKPLTTV
jgi:hypothetical protein